jgi:hypothetical protein
MIGHKPATYWFGEVADHVVSLAISFRMLLIGDRIDSDGDVRKLIERQNVDS